jgi:hypothetical protein
MVSRPRHIDQESGHNNGELRAAHLCHNEARHRKWKPVVRHGR